MTDPSLRPEPPIAALGRTLRRLRRDQGEPSLRDIARGTTVVNAKGNNNQLSHTTVASVLRCESLPPWPSVQRVVAVLGGDVSHFRHLWVEAKDAQERAAAGLTPPTTTPSPITPRRDPSEVPPDATRPTDPPQIPTSPSWATDSVDLFDHLMSDVSIASDGVARVDKTDLGPMDRIAKGAVGEVFRLGGHAFPGRQLAYKQILSSVTGQHRAETIWSMERAVALRNLMNSTDRAELDRVTAWPLAVVQDNGETVGTIMPLIPTDFFIELDVGNGRRENRVHAFAFLSASDSYTRRMGIDRSVTGNRLVRLGLVAHLSYAISLLHKYEIVYGDLSLANIAIAVNPPRALLLDCDATAALSDGNRRQMHSPNFVPPENRDGAQEVQDLETDVYKLGLCVLRGLVVGEGATQLSDPNVLAGSLSQEGIDLLTRALSADRSERPTAHQISLYLLAYLANQIASAFPSQPQRSVPTEPPIITPPRFGATPIYISYQRSEPHAAFLLAEYLSDSLGSGSVFINVGDFDPGTDIPTATDRAVSRCRAMLVVIGPNWLTISDSSDVPCVMDPDDPLRLELEYAFERKVPVIPVLLDNARRPQATRLPPSLAGLAHISASPVRSTTFKNDVTALADQLERMFSSEDPGDGTHSGDFV